MKIQIIETQEVRELTLIDPNTGVCYCDDFISHSSFDSFNYNDDGDVLMFVEDFDWWEKVVNDQQKLVNRIEALENEHDLEKVQAAIIDILGKVELEDEAALANQALDNAFGETTSY